MRETASRSRGSTIRLTPASALIGRQCGIQIEQFLRRQTARTPRRVEVGGAADRGRVAIDSRRCRRQRVRHVLAPLREEAPHQALEPDWIVRGADRVAKGERYEGRANLRWRPKRAGRQLQHAACVRVERREDCERTVIARPRNRLPPGRPLRAGASRRRRGNPPPALRGAAAPESAPRRRRGGCQPREARRRARRHGGAGGPPSPGRAPGCLPRSPRRCRARGRPAPARARHRLRRRAGAPPARRAAASARPGRGRSPARGRPPPARVRRSPWWSRPARGSAGRGAGGAY